MPTITLVPLSIEDTPCYHQLTGNSAVMQYITGETLTYQDTLQEVNRLVKKYSNQSNGGVWKCLDQDKFIGIGALIPISKYAADLGFRVLQSQWRQGYGMAIAQALLRKALTMDLDQLIAIIDHANFGSKRIIEHLDFEEVGTTPSPLGGLDIEYKKILR